MRVLAYVDDDFEDPELLETVGIWRDAGWQVTLAGREAKKDVTGKRGAGVRTDVAVSDVRLDDLDILFIPGGQAPDKMRLHAPFVDLARDAVAQGKLVAVICHGPQVLIEAGVVEGRRLAAWPSVWTDLRNAGAEVVDEAVVVDGNIVSSRKPEDIEAFASGVLAEAEKRQGGPTETVARELR